MYSVCIFNLVYKSVIIADFLSRYSNGCAAPICDHSHADFGHYHWTNCDHLRGPSFHLVPGPSYYRWVEPQILQLQYPCVVFFISIYFLSRLIKRKKLPSDYHLGTLSGIFSEALIKTASGLQYQANLSEKTFCHLYYWFISIEKSRSY